MRTIYQALTHMFVSTAILLFLISPAAAKDVENGGPQVSFDGGRSISVDPRGFDGPGNNSEPKGHSSPKATIPNQSPAPAPEKTPAPTVSVTEIEEAAGATAKNAAIRAGRITASNAVGNAVGKAVGAVAGGVIGKAVGDKAGALVKGGPIGVVLGVTFMSPERIGCGEGESCADPKKD